MIRADHKVFQDFIHMLLLGLVVGLIASLALA